MGVGEGVKGNFTAVVPRFWVLMRAFAHRGCEGHAGWPHDRVEPLQIRVESGVRHLRGRFREA